MRAGRSHSAERLADGLWLAAIARAGWGSLGGSVTQMAMPLVFRAFLGFALGNWWSWRLATPAAGGTPLLTGVAYYLPATDTPGGGFQELRPRAATLACFHPGASPDCQDSFQRLQVGCVRINSHRKASRSLSICRPP
jgi:hypothetical protein